MYDPLIVDAFIASFLEIAPAAILAGQQASTLMASIEDDEDATGTPLQSIRANAAQASTLAHLAKRFEEGISNADIIAVTTQFGRTLTPSAVCAFYVYSPETDILRCVESSGDPGRVLIGLTMKRGEHVTGWVAANEQSIVNSEAVLDLGEMANLFSPPLRSVIAGPLIYRDRLVGVVAGYSTRAGAFTEDHRYAFEQLVSMAAMRIGSAAIQGSPGSIVRFPAADRR
jgi:GAF domain-containing protein